MRTLQVKTACSQIPDLERRTGAETLFDLCVPLLNVLGRRVRIERGEAYRGCGQSACAQHGSAKVETASEQGRRRSEVIRLLGFRENIGDVMSLVAPGVLIDGRVEDSIRRVQHHPKARKILRKANSRREIVLVGVHQSARISQLAADKNRRRTVVEN